MTSLRRLFGWLIGLPLFLVIVDFAVANRQAEVVDPLWPLPWTVEVPVYLPVLAALALGVLLGAFTAGVSTLRARRRAGRERRRAESLARQLEAHERRAVPPAAEQRDQLPPPGL